jgi:hypothetical protein
MPRARRPIAALAAACLLLALATDVAGAASTVEVRIEGRTETIFEGPVRAEPRQVQAASDTEPRRCDGINPLVPENIVPAPTPTSASVDAMELIGEPFDARWYPGFEDYFVTRWGPDREENGMSWGIAVNNVFTQVGGCQYQLDDGDEALWIYDAFGGRPRLALLPPGYGAGPRPLTATAALGVPFEVEVVSYDDGAEGTPPPSPGRGGSAPFEGAAVAPVLTSAKGFERIDTASAEAVTTDAEGKASLTFGAPGWHRIKATVPGVSGAEEAIRSNRLDICVPAPGAGDCGEPPPEDRVRSLFSPPPPPSPTPTALAGPPSAGPDPVRLGALRLDRRALARGRVGVSWEVVSAGVGIERWAVSSRLIGRSAARWVKRAAGAAATSARLRLPPGAYRLRLTVTDRLGRATTIAIGRVAVPDARPR